MRSQVGLRRFLAACIAPVVMCCLMASCQRLEDSTSRGLGQSADAPPVPKSVVAVPAPGAAADFEQEEIDVDRLPRLGAESGVRIGSLTDPTVGFTLIGAVQVDRDGNVYVLEAAVPEIRVFDPVGVPVRKFGRAGDGPGEFRSVSRFGLHGDTVWVVDRRANRLTLFDRRGAVLSSRLIEPVRVGLPNSWGYVTPEVARPDGRFTGHMTHVGGLQNGPPSGVRSSDRIAVPFVLFDVDGSVLDTIGWAPHPPPYLWHPPSAGYADPARVPIDGRPMFVPTPPPTLSLWEGLDDGYIDVTNPLAERSDRGSFSVTRFGLSGDTVFARLFRYQPTRYSDSRLDEIAALAAQGKAGGFVPFTPGRPPPPDWESLATSLRGAMDFPEFELPLDVASPAGRPVFVANDETIWLRGPSAAATKARWIVLDANGNPRGTVELDTDVSVRWADDDEFWVVDPDELDVQWLVHHRLR